MDDPLLQVLAALSEEGQLTHVEMQPARVARYASTADPIAPGLLDAFGVTELWAHQAAAIDAVRAGQSIVVATGTASGKSLCYQLPIAEAVAGLRSPEPATAMLLFPTKALAQDQLRSFAELRRHRGGLEAISAATYDGDTSTEARTVIRRSSNVVLTNPEMLHHGILPSHGRWATFLRRLRFVVIDELHVLRGVFGSHMGHILRRLRRLCHHYGSNPVFVFTSATIGDPAALATALCGGPVIAIDDDASPRGQRLVVVWNPPLLDADSGMRVSPVNETARLLETLVAQHCRTVAFCRSRRATERVAISVRAALGAEPETAALADTVRAYRSGYLAAERRDLESQLFDGQLLGVVATSALELGVDIGGLDACILAGFPGTVASMRQQMGRAGREQQRSLAVLVTGNDQLDQWYAAHPGELFSRPPEPAVVNLANPTIAGPQVSCAAYELPLTPEDETWWGDELNETVIDLVRRDRLAVRDGNAYWTGRGTPSYGIGLRSGTSDEYRIERADGQLIGTVDASRAFDTVHPGAIYLHQGQQYQVRELDIAGRLAVADPVDLDEETHTRSSMQLTIDDDQEHAIIGRVMLHLGAVTVTTQVTGYERRDTIRREVIERIELDLPPSTLRTRGFWYTIDAATIDAVGLDPEQVGGTLHAVEHAGIGILPLFTICDRWDVGGISIPWMPETKAATIVIYDAYPGGAGIAELGFRAGRRHLEATRAVIERCRCRFGCPSCVQSPKCGNGNEPLDKAGALALLRTVLAR
ncbi:MAG: DEAD/DEAH box helicase [Acidimicrobiia bacterium]